MEPLLAGDPAGIGRYRLVGRLGSGGMGRVYLGRAPDGRLAAVKVVHDGYAGDPTFRTRFAHEVAVARRVHAPWAAAVLDADPDAARPWLATEYIDGPSLQQTVMAGGPLPEPALAALAVGLAGALAELHRMDVLHRDVKPSNVLLAPDGPKLIDFGVAKATDATRITHTGMVVGTPAFMSPEQASDDPVGLPADVFGLAAVLVFAASGQGPFGEASNAVAMMLRVVQSEPDLSAVPDWLATELRPCLAKDPGARPTAGDLAYRLSSKAPATRHWSPPSQPTVVVAPKDRGSRPSGWLIGAGCVAVLAVLAVLVAVYRPEAPTPAAAPAAGPAAPTVAAVAPHELEQAAQLRPLSVTPGPSSLLGHPIRGIATPRDSSRVLLAMGAYLVTVDPSGTAVRDQMPFDYPQVFGVATQPGGAQAYVSLGDGEVRSLDLATKQLGPGLGPFGNVQQLSATADGRRVVVLSLSGSGKPGGMYVVDLATQSSRLVVPLPDARFLHMVVAPDGRRAYVAHQTTDINESPPIQAVDLGTGAITEYPYPADGWVAPAAQGMTISPDGRWLYARTSYCVLKIDTASKVVTSQLKLGQIPTALGVSPSGRYLFVSTSANPSMHVVETDDLTKEVGRAADIGTAVNNLTVSPDGQHLYFNTTQGMATMATGGFN